MLSRPPSLHNDRFAPGKSLIGNVLNRLAGPILRGDLKPGERLPREAEIMGQLGISRTALRDAIKVLAGKGLVETRQKTGTRVQPRSDWNLLDRDVLGWLTSVQEPETFMRELHELRMILEPGAAALAATRATADEIATLRETCDRMDAAGQDADKFTDADFTFHSTVLAASRNDFLLTLASVMKASLMTFFRMTGEDPDAFEIGRPLHRRVSEHIAAGEPDRARDAMLALLREAEPVIARLSEAARKERGMG